MDAEWLEKFRARLWFADNHDLQRSGTYAYRQAIRKGEIVPGPCAVCGETRGVHGHHEDYAKPLDVIWLCSVHHSWRHRYKHTVEEMIAFRESA